MNAPVDAALHDAHQLAEAIEQACERIAPTWPLDQFIAVNPYWGWVKQPAREAAAHLRVLAGTTLTMPREWFREQWRAGRLQRCHLEEAARRRGQWPSAQDLIDALESDDAPPLPRLPLVTDLCDTASPAVAASWADVVTHQISQHCAAFFDSSQARWHLDRSAGLYGTWKRQIAADRGLAWPGGRRAALERIAALPGDPLAAIGLSVAALGIAPAARSAYLSALLLSINGWAAWCAYERWQARLSGTDNDAIIELLAVRASWESLLDGAAHAATPEWIATWSAADASIALVAQEQRMDWALQEALEAAYQLPLAGALAAASTSALVNRPAVQAVFCIDVRSEVFRRALEAADPGMHTRGFAGFFGLPIAYTPTGSSLTRPQLPGLLAPKVTVTEVPIEGAPLGAVLARQRRSALQWRQRWADLRNSAASGFSFVEACGLAYGAKLLAESLPRTANAERWEEFGLPDESRGARPRLPQVDADPVAAAAMAKGILHAMGLPDRLTGFAPLVLLAGHGSQSANNPHAAGLDCGACGGQTGEVNARALADMLNTPAVRAALDALGVAIPPGTHFVPGLHNTTTDDVVLFDTDRVPPARAGELARLRRALTEAGRRARAERASRLGLVRLAADAEALAKAVRERANDWAQVRPEWALADCAAFIVAPRRRTQGLDLGGRSFLHDYDYRQDEDLAVLELIMTAPMVVTNWINLQYHASTVDNRRYGSGNKVLHNVVGGRIGVFEGNGGDLRIGLPLQSLHDGQVLRHTPLRLSVFIEAPREAVDAVVARHAVVRDLVDHGWLHLLRIDPGQPWVEQRRAGRWVTVAGQAAPVPTAGAVVAQPG